RERLLAELKAQWSRLAVLFQQAPTFLAILRGPDYVFEMVNPAYQMLVNQRAVLGKPARNALPEFEDQGYFALLDHVYASGEPFVGNEMRIELQDGDGVIDYYLNFIYHPILDRDGTVTGI